MSGAAHERAGPENEKGAAPDQEDSAPQTTRRAHLSTSSKAINIEPVVARVCRSHHWQKFAEGPRHIDEPLTDHHIKRHLTGRAAFGACPIAPGESTTRLALIDFDSHDGTTPWDQMLATAQRVADTMTICGLEPVLWRSSGGHGIHLYLLWDRDQDAASVREMLRQMLVPCGLKPGTGGVVKGECEIFPKQPSVSASGSGSMFILAGAGQSERLTPGGDWPMSADVPHFEKPAPVERTEQLEGSADLAELSALLAAIPNEGEKSLTYTDWFRVVCAVHHETGGSDEGLALVEEFSERSEKADLGFLRDRVWNYVTSDRDNPITIGTLRKMARDAQNPADDFEALPDENPKPTPLSNIAPYSVFCANVEAPRYVWHHVLQYGCLYGLTAKWGHGKTAVMLTVALHAATGQVLGRHPVEKCRVLYLCGENPADVQLRAIAIAQHFEISPEDLNAQVYFTRRPFAIDDPRQLKTFLEDAQQYGPFGLVVIDTGPAHSAADEENDNREMHALAMAMRRLMEPLGMPATVALMHPTKEAAKDNLQPRGGGAFSGSIDGELCAWQSDGIIEFFHRTKFRGPGFAPVFFKLQPYTLPGVLDNFGQPVQTILAVETDEKPARAPTGKWRVLVWQAVHELVGLGDEWVSVEAVIAKVLEGVARDPGAGRDLRKQHVVRATNELAAQGFVIVENDQVRVA